MDETPTYALAEALWQSRQLHPEKPWLMAVYHRRMPEKVIVALLPQARNGIRWVVLKQAWHDPAQDIQVICAHAAELKLILPFEHNIPTATGWRPITDAEAEAL